MPGMNGCRSDMQASRQLDGGDKVAHLLGLHWEHNLSVETLQATGVGVRG